MENVEDLIPLTPMQRTMLLRALSTGGQESLFQQFVFEIEGVLDPEAFSAAWSRAVECHSSLRSAFLWRGLKQPLQVIRREVTIPFTFVDCAEDGGDGQTGNGAVRNERVARLLETDKEAGFDLSTAPLTRVALLRFSETQWSFVWTSHHLVLDRWSIAPLLNDVWRAYEAQVRSAAGSPSRGGALRRSRFQDYVSWIEKQDAEAAEAHWASRLGGLSRATRALTVASEGAPSEAAEFSLDPARSAQLRAAAQIARVTPGVIFQAAWAIVLAEFAAESSTESSTGGDVCFGLTVSGRPPAVPGVERMVGSFIGNVPVRVTFTAGLTVLELCQSLLREGQSRAPFEYMTPIEIHRIAGLAPGQPLFDSLLLWLSQASAKGPEGLGVTAVPGEPATAWPLTISVLEEAGALSVAARTAPASVLQGGRRVADLVGRLEEVLLAVVGLLTDASDARLGDHFGLGGRFVELPDAGVPLAWSPEDPELSAKPPAKSVGRSLGATPAEFDAGGREFDDPQMMQELLYDECQALLPQAAPLDPALGFFEQGGSSMLAAQLHARLEAMTGRALPLLELFEAPTLADMAKEFTSKPWPLLGGVLRAVRKEGTRPPLFCVSSPEVNSLGYVTLSRHLSADQPVYLTQGRPSGTEAVFRMAVSDIPRLAKDSVDAMLESFPTGPYRLFGMCDGALVAFEMARLLEERGAEVDFLCLLNTYSLGTLSKRYKVKRVVTRAGYYRRRVGEVLVEKLRPSATAASDKPRENAAPQGAEAAPAAQADGAASLQERLASINGEWFKLDTPRYLPKAPVFRGRITVLRNTAQPYWRIRDHKLGWGAYSNDVEVVDVQIRREATEGRDRRAQQDAHMALLREPDIEHVARAVNERLDELSRNSSSASDSAARSGASAQARHAGSVRS